MSDALIAGLATAATLAAGKVLDWFFSRRHAALADDALASQEWRALYEKVSTKMDALDTRLDGLQQSYNTLSVQHARLKQAFDFLIDGLGDTRAELVAHAKRIAAGYE